MANLDSLADRSAFELAALVKAKEVSAQEVTEAALKRVEQVDGTPGHIDGDPSNADGVHAFISLSADQALEEAKGIDQRISKGEIPGALAGVPYTVKDIFVVKDTLSTAASKILANFKSPYTATSVDRMQKAGAVMIGKVNLDEFTFGSSNESSAYQPSPRNPWNLKHVPGGSSGGSAAAVASGQGALSLGTDTAGSIRQPAAFCGVVGLKPTYGRVSRYGLIAFGSSLDSPGPVARNVRDAGLMLNTIAGPDSMDSTAANIPVSDFTAGLEDGVKGMRIGLSPDYDQINYFDVESGELRSQSLPKEISNAVEQAADRLSDMGARIIENIPMPHTHTGIPAFFVISRVEAASNLHRFDGVKYGYRSESENADMRQLYRQTRGEAFGLQPKLRILMGMYVSAAQYSEQYYQKALRIRSLLRQDFDHIFDEGGQHKLDALLTPTTPSTAFPMGDVYGDSVMMQYSDQFTVPANHAGVPAISVPAALSSEKMPIGIQFIASDYSEGKLLRIARAYEMATEEEQWRHSMPAVLENLA
jgi:aspartyl-tRNA(Asn)/glutamyl-tRNA(Gln) amidotransferase subunit A